MNGILLVDKPQDWTSFDVAAKIRGLCATRRVGHSGTLDPLATGLLVLFLGRATRAVSFAEAHDKRYLASFRPGLVTDTQDITGRVLERCERSVTERELEEALSAFRGEILQTPPMYSAIRIGGQRLYDIARRGGEVERAPRAVTIRSLELLGRDENGDFLLDVRCSKGTYVRTLCDDIGRALGVGGCMSALRRTEAGCFSVADAHTMDELCAAGREGIEKMLLGLDALFPELPRVTADEAAERQIRCGSTFKSDAADGRCLAYSESGEPLALCEAKGGTLRTIKSFFEV